MSLNIAKSNKKRVVIVGGGFGGLKLANKLKKSGFQVVLIDKNNYHQFPPLIYQVASAGMEPTSISFPFRKIFQHRKDFYFRMAEVRAIFPEKNMIQTSIGKAEYDYLVLAAGTTTNFFGNKHIEEEAMPMKNVSEAMGLRNALLANLERALTCSTKQEQQELLNIVIVGGGKLGYSLAINMLDRDFRVNVIEKNKVRAMNLANELDAEVICGDGTELEVLMKAGVQEADCFIAVTGQDQDNLVACQLAKKRFRVPKVITRANDHRNLLALRNLGADIAVSSTEIITRAIEQEVDSAGMHLLASLNRGKAAICALTLPENSRFHGMSLKDIQLPQNSLIVSVVHQDVLTIPQGSTVLSSGDEIVAICESDQQKELMKMFR